MRPLGIVLAVLFVWASIAESHGTECEYPAFELQVCWQAMDDHFSDNIGVVPVFTESELDNACSFYWPIHDCARDVLQSCHLHYQDYLQFKATDDTYRFLCNDTREEYLEHITCLSREEITENHQTCSQQFVDNTDQLARDPYYGTAAICRFANVYLDCLENGTRAVCGPAAALWLRELDTLALEPHADDLHCELEDSDYRYHAISASTTARTNAGSTNGPNRPRTSPFADDPALVTTTPTAQGMFNMQRAMDEGIIVGCTLALGLLLSAIILLLLLKSGIFAKCPACKRKSQAQRAVTPHILPQTEVQGATALPVTHKGLMPLHPPVPPPYHIHNFHRGKDIGQEEGDEIPRNDKAQIDFSVLPPIGGGAPVRYTRDPPPYSYSHNISYPLYGATTDGKAVVDNNGN